MNVIETALAGVRILEPQVFGDARGWFMESWSKKKMEDAGITVDLCRTIIPSRRRRGHCADCIIS